MKNHFFKRLLSLLLILVASFSFAQTPKDFQFEKTTQKFKRVGEGDQITLTYNFTYTGKKVVEISNKEIDCSCTTINYSNQLILPNSNNQINIKFDTKDKIGWQERNVIIQFKEEHSEIYSDPYFEKTLIFKGFVKAKKSTKESYKLNKKNKISR